MEFNVSLFCSQMHDVEFAESLNPVINEALPTLEKLRKEGKIRFIGVTGYPLNVLKEAIVRAKGRLDVSVTGYGNKFWIIEIFMILFADRFVLFTVHINR